MISVLRFGNQATVELALRDGTTVTFCDAPQGCAIDDVRTAVRRALGEPLELPPLVQAVVPGDKVALAIADGVPRIAEIVDETIAQLVSAGVEVNSITVLCTQGDPDLGGAPATRAGAPIVVHDPAHRESLSYLAASADGKPIYVNRAVHDADLVVTIGRVRPAGSLGDHGIHADLLADFSDAANRDRFHSPKPVLPGRRDRLHVDADEAGWLLGTGYTIRVVPARAGGVLGVLAGDAAAVDRRAQRVYDEAWGCQVPERAELVIATIEGGASQQTWINLARALEAASGAAQADAAIAVCCELEAAPGAGVQQLIGADDLNAALRAIVHLKPADALAAGGIVRALDRGRVYLVSRLADELVEDLGMRPLAAEDLSRLAAHFNSVTVLRNAPFAVAHVLGEVGAPADVYGRAR